MPILVSRIGSILVVLCIFSLGYAAPLASQTADKPLYLDEGELPTLAPLLAQVTPAVVNISVESQQTAALNPLLNDPFFKHFFQALFRYAADAAAAPTNERRLWRDI